MNCAPANRAGRTGSTCWPNRRECIIHGKSWRTKTATWPPPPEKLCGPLWKPPLRWWEISSASGRASRSGLTSGRKNTNGLLEASTTSRSMWWCGHPWFTSPAIRWLRAGNGCMMTGSSTTARSCLPPIWTNRNIGRMGCPLWPTALPRIWCCCRS